jgi:hypothetical protein
VTPQRPLRGQRHLPLRRSERLPISRRLYRGNWGGSSVMGHRDRARSGRRFSTNVRLSVGLIAVVMTAVLASVIGVIPAVAVGGIGTAVGVRLCWKWRGNSPPT